MQYKHIVFDVDGTLINTEYAVLNSLQETVKATTGKTIEFNELVFALGITGRDALEKLNIADIPVALELWNKNMLKFNDTVSVFDGITDLLANLVLSGYDIGIVTSKTRAEFEDEFRRFNINNYFGKIVCANDTSKHKPSPEPLLKYMDISQTKNHELLYIGDSVYDMKCAENANIDFALACWGSFSKDIKANYYLEKPSDLIPIVDSK